MPYHTKLRPKINKLSLSLFFFFWLDVSLCKVEVSQRNEAGEREVDAHDSQNVCVGDKESCSGEVSENLDYLLSLGYSSHCGSARLSPVLYVPNFCLCVSISANLQSTVFWLVPLAAQRQAGRAWSSLSTAASLRRNHPLALSLGESSCFHTSLFSIQGLLLMSALQGNPDKKHTHRSALLWGYINRTLQVWKCNLFSPHLYYSRN